MPLILNCEYCKKDFITRKRSERIIRFCSKLCSKPEKIEKWKIIHKNWKDQPREECIKIMQQSFETFINKSNECWLWNGAGKGRKSDYGSFTFRGKGMRAHRASYFIYKGEIPERMLVLHKCDIPRCVNPDHLWLGTYLDNNRDKVSKGRGTCEKLTIDQVKEIKKLLRIGVMNKKIMQDYKISNVTVHAIKTGKTWKDIN